MALMTPEVTAPMEAPPPIVRPAATFSVVAVVGRSFGVWGRNFVPFSIVTLVAHVPTFVLVAVMPTEAGAVWTGVQAFVSFVAGLVAVGALTHGVLESLRGGDAGVGALLRSGVRNLGPILAVSFRVGLWIVLGFVLLVVPGLMWYCALYVAIPAIVVERDLESSAAALERSRELTRGHRAAIFAVALVVTVVGVVCGLAFEAAARVLADGLLSLRALEVLGVATTALIGGVSECAAAVAYHDLRIAKEGVSTAELVKVFE